VYLLQGEYRLPGKRLRAAREKVAQEKDAQEETAEVSRLGETFVFPKVIPH
jgi:hypothetical protein